MTLDLERLRDLFPELPDEIANHYAFCAAAALFVWEHTPGVSLSLDLDAQPFQHVLTWRAREPAQFAQLDVLRATENGAEAIALAVVHAHRRGWRLVRRLQSRFGEGADWLFEETATNIAVEVSGMLDGDVEKRTEKKLRQAESSPAASQFAACVVQFKEPRALFWESKSDGTP